MFNPTPSQQHMISLNIYIFQTPTPVGYENDNISVLLSHCTQAIPVSRVPFFAVVDHMVATFFQAFEYELYQYSHFELQHNNLVGRSVQHDYTVCHDVD
mmetsp:Transcript_30083/g.39370  ORF Transcript_30083/g.39370 Transcript_30083/m.39370 type:complete len:99 (+) Transcript_30083:330-626(+)